MRTLMLALALTLGAPVLALAADAFPGAVGYGKATAGGRGGEVVIVDSLADSGPGTLRACLTMTGPRHCVIVVSGTIETDTPIFVRTANGSVSVWGQASPGGVQVTRRVGAWPRDALDARQVREMSGASSTGTTPTAGGPWPVLTGPAAPADTDRDGMADAWEASNGLVVGTRDHDADPDGDGYTAVEQYMAELMDGLLP